MALTRSFIRNAVTTPTDARVLLMGLIVANADGSPRPGVLGGANPAIVSTLPSMNVAIAAAEFVTTKGRADGVAIFGNDGVVNVPIEIAPTSNSRIDVIYVKHNDNTTGDANALPIFAVAKGTAAASPTKPAIPTGALELATLRIYSGTTATNGGANALVNTYQMTAPRGAMVPFRTKTELDAWANAAPGQAANDLSTGTSYHRSGGRWSSTGVASVVSVTSSAIQSIPSSADTTVLFPTGALTTVAVAGSDLSYDAATGVVTALAAGVYRIEGQAVWAAGGSIGSHILFASKNNGGLIDGVGRVLASLGTFNVHQVMSVSTSFEMAAGDTLRLRAFQTSLSPSKALGVPGGPYYKTMTVTRLA